MKYVSWILAGVLACGLMATGSAWAQGDDDEAQITELAGTVSVEKDADGAITAVMLNTTGGDSVAIKLDGKGKQLAKAAADGQQVEVEGTLADEDGQQTLTIKSFSLVTDEDEGEQVEE